MPDNTPLEAKIEVNNWIVWHRGTGNIFKSETEAMDFICAEQEKSPSYKFTGWRQTMRGNNMGTVLSNFDEVHQLQERERYNQFFKPIDQMLKRLGDI